MTGKATHFTQQFLPQEVESVCVCVGGGSSLCRQGVRKRFTETPTQKLTSVPAIDALPLFTVVLLLDYLFPNLQIFQKHTHYFFNESILLSFRLFPSLSFSFSSIMDVSRDLGLHGMCRESDL